jgi:hypothetical protein
MQESVMNDPIIAELRKIRDEYAARFNYDIDAIMKDLRKKEKEFPHKLVKLKPRKLKPKAK